MIRHLELPSNVAAQQTILLGKLPGWTAGLLEKKLESLEAKAITLLASNGSSERRISLHRLSEVPSLDSKEKELWVLLRTFISE